MYAVLRSCSAFQVLSATVILCVCGRVCLCMCGGGCIGVIGREALSFFHCVCWAEMLAPAVSCGGGGVVVTMVWWWWWWWWT